VTPPRIRARAVRGVQRIVGSSAALASVRETVTRFSKLAVPVLITGETGTGKELVARALHEEGANAEEPFVAINCGAISESLLESELFGHEKGAFSGAATAHRGLFEEAGKGSILLDEIGEISSRLQIALLRVLESGEIRPVGSSRPKVIRCRILASTNADLERLAEAGNFRADILYRLRRLQIHIPPLRERREDILPLAAHFLDVGRAPETHAMMSPSLVDVLRRHPWPGNVRELRNSIERMRLMNSDKLYYDRQDLEIGAAPLPHVIPSEEEPAYADTPPASRAADGAPPPPAEKAQPTLRQGRSGVRRLALLRELFEQHKVMTRDEVIRTLGISPNTATKDLRTLCGEGSIVKVQPSRSPRSAYFEWRGGSA
jgi:DNA-binding NtrC family response regulator